MADTNIEWADKVWNPIAGCSDKSEGCRNCYARGMARRLEAMGQEKYKGLTILQGSHVVWTGKIAFDEEALLKPLSWKKPKRIFVNSMSDLFHDNVSDNIRDKVFAVMALCPQHTFMVLTKRPKRMSEYVSDRHLHLRIHEAVKGLIGYYHPSRPAINARSLPLPNALLGTSVENQKAADDRLDYLCDVASFDWRTMVSFEPLLGPVDPGSWWLSLGAKTWAIVGGESGHNARPMHPDWARSLAYKCAVAGVPYFFKQWGEWKPISEMPESEHNALYVSNKKAREGEEWRQGELDEMYGRRCTVAVEAMNFAGDTGLNQGFQVIDGHAGMTFFSVGKKAAGNLLDGREWKQFPEVRQ